VIVNEAVHDLSNLLLQNCCSKHGALYPQKDFVASLLDEVRIAPTNELFQRPIHSRKDDFIRQQSEPCRSVSISPRPNRLSVRQLSAPCRSLSPVRIRSKTLRQGGKLELAPPVEVNRRASIEKNREIQTTDWVFVSKDLRLPLWGTSRTIEALKEQKITRHVCLSCSSVLGCIDTAHYILCPQCRCIMATGMTTGESGVGLGFYYDGGLTSQSEHIPWNANRATNAAA
jgi:hypothetical protein